MVNHMRAFVSLLSLVSVLWLCGACSRSAPSAGANEGGAVNSTAASSGANSSASNHAGGVGGQGFDTSKMDAEIAHLEQQAEKNPDDDTTLRALAGADARRGR